MLCTLLCLGLRALAHALELGAPVPTSQPQTPPSCVQSHSETIAALEAGEAQLQEQLDAKNAEFEETQKEVEAVRPRAASGLNTTVRSLRSPHGARPLISKLG